MLQWERGRRLAKYGAITYKYDAAGIRQEKQTRTTTHTYYTEGSRIHRETRAHYANNYNLWYYYDQTGICAFECNGTMYHMKKNLQGDIVMLLDVDGNVAAKYVYDAWGNHKVLNPSNAEIRNDTFIGNINPFRYRSYYYDADTKLYYLNSRYYDPEIGRFINADSIDFAEPDSISGLNLYAYCKNNPVMFTDNCGNYPIPILRSAIKPFPRFKDFNLFHKEGYAWYSGKQPVVFNGSPYLTAIGHYLGWEVDATAVKWHATLLKTSQSGLTIVSSGIGLFEGGLHFTDEVKLGFKLGTAAVNVGFDFDTVIGVEAIATAGTIGIDTKHVDVDILLGSFGFSLKFDEGGITLAGALFLGISIKIKWW